MPGTKASSSSTANKVNCAGSWGNWSACVDDSQSRFYTVTTQASGGGTACPNVRTETQACTSPTTTVSPNKADTTSNVDKGTASDSTLVGASVSDLDVAKAIAQSNLSKSGDSVGVIVSVEPQITLDIAAGKTVAELEASSDVRGALASAFVSSLNDAAVTAAKCKVRSITEVRRELLLSELSSDSADGLQVLERSPTDSRRDSRRLAAKTVRVKYDLSLASAEQSRSVAEKLESTSTTLADTLKTNAATELGNSVAASALVSDVSSVDGASITATMSQTKVFDWGSMPSSGTLEMQMQTCNVGDKIYMHWKGSYPHDLRQLSTEAKYVGCEFTGTTGTISCCSRCAEHDLLRLA